MAIFTLDFFRFWYYPSGAQSPGFLLGRHFLSEKSHDPFSTPGFSFTPIIPEINLPARPILPTFFIELASEEICKLEAIIFNQPGVAI
jgi:hypothetical protein